MSTYRTARCPRCGHVLDGPFYEPCPVCAKEGHNLNHITEFDLSGAKLPGPGTGDEGIFRFRDFYAIGDGDPVVSLHEGNTPLYRLNRLGKALGFENLYVKDESRNPTGSHKDRLCAVIVSRALAEGAPGITVSSTGNQGMSAAAYASAAGLPCVIFTTPNVSDTMKTAMQIYGAKLFVLPTMADRTVLMERCVRDFGFVPASGLASPPIGSSCFGVDGYKSISFEIYEQMDQSVPDWVVMPISYGDGMYGIYKGMRDLKEMKYIDRLPRMAAAEVYGGAKETMRQKSEFPIPAPGEPSIQTSIATPWVTWQTVHALYDCNGAAETCADPEALEMQKELARTEGIYAETASVASLVAAKKLLDAGTIRKEERVVAVITSPGVKDPAVSRAALPEAPAITASVDEWKKAMKDVYGYELR